MKRIMVNKIGDPRAVLEVKDVEDLVPAAGEVLVQMLAIPIHPADLLVMRGRHVFTPKYPCGTHSHSKWKAMTSHTARARKPLMSGR